MCLQKKARALSRPQQQTTNHSPGPTSRQPLLGIALTAALLRLLIAPLVPGPATPAPRAHHIHPPPPASTVHTQSTHSPHTRTHARARARTHTHTHAHTLSRLRARRLQLAGAAVVLRETGPPGVVRHKGRAALLGAVVGTVDRACNVTIQCCHLLHCFLSPVLFIYYAAGRSPSPSSLQRWRFSLDYFAAGRSPSPSSHQRWRCSTA